MLGGESLVVPGNQVLLSHVIPERQENLPVSPDGVETFGLPRLLGAHESELPGTEE